MIRRIVCWVRGHRWQDRWSFHPGDGTTGLFDFQNDYYERFGITVLARVCSYCSATRQRKFVGNLKEIHDSNELDQLRRMAGLH